MNMIEIEKKFEQIVTKFGANIKNRVKMWAAKTGHLICAEDTYQNVLIRVLQNIEKFNLDDDSAKKLIFTLTKRQIVDDLRSEGRAQGITRYTSESHAPELSKQRQVELSDEFPDEKEEDFLFFDDLKAITARLDPLSQQYFRLVARGDSPQQAAKALGMNENTYKNTKTKGLAVFGNHPAYKGNTLITLNQ